MFLLKYAKWNERTIYLDRLERSEYQRIFTAAKKSEVRCLQCENEVRLYLGIQQTPYFYHLNSKYDSICGDNEQPPVAATVEENKEAISVGGFHLPKGRSIKQKEAKDLTQWKAAKKAIIQKPFQEKKLEVDNGPFALDVNQQKAVETIEGPVLVLAGAGSGKTRVLASRAVHMIEQNIPPASMMLVTFTSKAAKEMKERIQTYLNDRQIKAPLPLTGTFHSIFYRILCHHDPKWKDTNRLLKWDWQKEQYIIPKLREMGLEEKDFPFDQALGQISYWKNMMLTPSDVDATNKWEKEAKALYAHYEQQKEEHGTFDFDDMLIKCYELLKTNPLLLKKYQERFRYFFIDEFQDINPVQYELMKMLSEHTKNVFAVGDDDQSIYSFRGSDPTIILHFKDDFPNAKVVQLKANYRSSHNIVSCAHSIIKRNKNRYPKEVFAQFTCEDKPIFFYPFDEEEEATMIIQDMKERIQKGESPNHFAILYRTHSMARAIFERLSESNIPFQIENDYESFYEKKMIKSILSFLRLSVNEEDVTAISHLLSALFIKQAALSDLKALSILEDCTFIDALPKLQGLKPFQVTKLNKVKRLLPKLKEMKPIHALDVIEKDLGFADFVKKRGHEGNKIEKGSDEIRDLKVAAKQFQTVQSFLAHVDHMVAKTKEMKKDKHKRGVQLMTIHRAKGLEFENVYILAAVDGGIPHDYALDAYSNGDDAPLEEERRLLYVAITRAKKYVALSLLQTRRGKSANRSRFLHPILRDK
ncbi:ATP-dependent helicase [Bacillus sp. FJAT-47783]|uniref:ATP-dependent helicase n=1 Tax=Bacillus sp. FJAT-47783 TaxID=2922712 RepID=UPI001FAE54D5